MIAQLQRDWHALLPHAPALGAELMERWSEPRRSYHGLEHLANALTALAVVGGGSRVERLALWFHDAVHTGTAGADESASADLASSRLTRAGLADSDVIEVVRLVLVTIDHSPIPDDHSGARVSDADLAILGAEPTSYLASVAALRGEFSGSDERAWQLARRRQLTVLLARNALFHTPIGRSRWEAPARANLIAELAGLTPPPQVCQSPTE